MLSLAELVLSAPNDGCARGNLLAEGGILRPQGFSAEVGGGQQGHADDQVAGPQGVGQWGIGADGREAVHKKYVDVIEPQHQRRQDAQSGGGDAKQTQHEAEAEGQGDAQTRRAHDAGLLKRIGV